MTIASNSDVDYLASVLRSLLIDGEQLPPSDSAAFHDFGQAVGAMLRRKSDAEYERLGVLALSVLIDRGRGSIAADKALRKFIQPEGDW